MMPYAPGPNPYAAPAPGAALYRQNVFVPHGATAGDVPSPWMRNAKLALGIVQLVALTFAIGAFVGAGLVEPEDQQALLVTGGLLFGLWYLTLLGFGIANLIWVHKFWSWIPPEQRHTKLWKKYISPGMAVGLMFVPYFNIFWMFVVYLGICEVFERLAVAYPTSKPVPKNLALAMLIVPMLFFPASPFLHFLFDKHVEEMARETQARMAASPQPAPGYVPPGYPG